MVELLPSLLRAPVLESQPVVLVKKVVTLDKKDSGLFMRYYQDVLCQSMSTSLWSNGGQIWLKKSCDTFWCTMQHFVFCQICLYVKGVNAKAICEQRVPYAITENQWVGYDDKDSLEEKVSTHFIMTANSFTLCRWISIIFYQLNHSCYLSENTSLYKKVISISWCNCMLWFNYMPADEMFGRNELKWHPVWHLSGLNPRLY